MRRNSRENGWFFLKNGCTKYLRKRFQFENYFSPGLNPEIKLRHFCAIETILTVEKEKQKE